MFGRLGFRLVLALVLFLPALATPVFAQDATPSAGSMMGTPAADEGTMDNPMPGTTAAPANTAGLSIVASGLAGPRGVAWDGSGALYVGLAGTGGTTPGTGEAMGAMGSSNRGGPSASIVKVVAGCGVPVARGLPSYISGAGSARGVAAITFLGDDLYALLQGAGAEKGNPDWSNGVVRIDSSGNATPIFDLVEWMAANPVAHVPGDFDVNGDPFGLITVGRELFLAEANSSQIIQITEQGQATRAVDLSENHPVVTGLTSDPAGNLYVGYLTEAPYQDGASRVDRVAPDGTVTTVWTGLTAVTGLAFGPDHTLYAIEMTHNMQGGSGRLVKQTGPDSLAEVVTGLDYPVHLAAGPDGGLYISLPALGSLTGGAVLRVDPAAAIPMQYAPDALTAKVCSGAAIPADAGSSTASPEAGADPITGVATDLANPRGMTWNDQGDLFVAQSGTGDDATSVGTASSVVQIVNGCPVAVASGLPSTFDPFRDVLGPQDIAFFEGSLYVLQGSTGSLESMDPNKPNGIYRVTDDGQLELFADLTTWLNANPVAHPPGDRNPRGEPYRILAGDGFFWVLDSNSGEVLHVHRDGSVMRAADTSDVHEVATGFALAPDGGAYVGFLTPAPHPDGSAKVIHVGTDMSVMDVWTNLTTVTGVAVAPDGSLYAIEMATGNDTPDGMRPNTGRLVHQTGPDSSEVIVDGLNYPIDLEMGPDGALYIAGPAYGGDDRDGWIIRVDPNAGANQTIPAGLTDEGQCPGAAPATPAAEPVETATETPADATPADTSAASAGTEVVTIQDFAFGPQTLTISAGTTVTWTNNDTSPHTSTAANGEWDSGNLNQGESFSFTFTTPGTYDYVCIYHGGMTGTIIVT